MTDLDRSTLELRDPDTDSEPWPRYTIAPITQEGWDRRASQSERSGMVVVYLAVLALVGIGVVLWWWKS